MHALSFRSKWRAIRRLTILFTFLFGSTAIANPQQYRLTNGLRVVLDQDARTPLVAVTLCVHVGGVDHPPGKSGIAHLFEHLFEQDSAHISKKEFDRVVREIGASHDASTVSDYTIFYASAPANQLETILWRRSDQLGFLGDDVTPARLANEKQVVLNERRVRIDRVPDGRGLTAMAQALYPPSHPMHEGVLGEPADIESITLAEMRAYYRDYYQPSNATLVIVGNFDSEKATGLVNHYFGSLQSTKPGAARPKIATVLPPATQLRLEVADHVSEPELVVAWVTAPAYSKDEPGLRVLASLLGDGGRRGLLYKRLVEQRRVAKSVRCNHIPLGTGSLMQCTLSPAEGVQPERLNTELADALKQLVTEGPSERELAREKARLRLEMIQGVEEPVDRANVIAEYVHFVDDPDYFSHDLAAVDAVDAAAIRALVSRWLNSERQVSVVVKPERP
jgi:zinc protease